VAIRRIILLLAALLLLTRAGFGQDEGKPEEERERARARWKKLDDEARKRHREILRRLLEGKTDEEKKKTLERLKRLKEKGDRERLHDRHRKMRELERRLLKAMPETLRKKVEALDKKLCRPLLYYTMRRTMEVTGEQFIASLEDAERKELSGLRGREWWKKALEIGDRRIVAGLTLEHRNRLEAMPEAERKAEMGNLRKAAFEGGMREAEKKVFVEIEKLLGQPIAVIKKTLEQRRPRGTWGGGRRRGGDVRPHHRKGHRFPDRELHDLLHHEKLSKTVQKQMDKEYLGIMEKHRDPESLKKALDEFKTRLRKLIAD